jgi:hypothetical protein
MKMKIDTSTRECGGGLMHYWISEDLVVDTQQIQDQKRVQHPASFVEPSRVSATSTGVVIAGRGASGEVVVVSAACGRNNGNNIAPPWFGCCFSCPLEVALVFGAGATYKRFGIIEYRKEESRREQTDLR